MDVTCRNCGAGLTADQGPVEQMLREANAMHAPEFVILADGYLLHHCELSEASLTLVDDQLRID